MKCSGSNQAMKASRPSSSATSRNRTKAVILCMSRRTLRAIASALMDIRIGRDLQQLRLVLKPQQQAVQQTEPRRDRYGRSPAPPGPERRRGTRNSWPRAPQAPDQADPVCRRTDRPPRRRPARSLRKPECPRRASSRACARQPAKSASSASRATRIRTAPVAAASAQDTGAAARYPAPRPAANRQ